MSDDEDDELKELNEFISRLHKEMTGRRGSSLGYYILDAERRAVALNDSQVLEWAKWLEEHRAEKVVKQEQIGPYWISTVFLGFDHGMGRIFGNANARPLLFETMAFVLVGIEHRLQVRERCSTWHEAEEQHERVAATFRKAVAG